MSEVKSIAKSDIVDITTLQLWDKNPRSINKERFAELKNRLSRQGQIKPLLVTKDGVVIGGNMRLRALTELGVKEVWVSVTDAVTDKEIFDLALTDNEEFGYYEQEQVAELALSLGLTPLELKSYSLSLGAPTTLDLVLDKFGPEPEEDEAPEVDEENTYSIEGEVYQLGPHRVMCGSSTNPDDVAKLLQGSKINMIFTDPPYGIDYSGGRTQVVATKTYGKLMGDKETDISEFITAIMSVANGVDTYICLSPINLKDGVNLVDNLKGVIVWKKPQPGLGYQFIRRYCEFILFATDREKRKDDASEFDFWDIATDSKTDYQHGTQKPVALALRAIKYSSQHNGIVLDLFGGSGSTLMACEHSDRINLTMELDPKYVDVIRKRYAKHVGEEEAWQEATPAVIQ